MENKEKIKKKPKLKKPNEIIIIPEPFIVKIEYGKFVIFGD